MEEIVNEETEEKTEYEADVSEDVASDPVEDPETAADSSESSDTVDDVKGSGSDQEKPEHVTDTYEDEEEEPVTYEGTVEPVSDPAAAGDYAGYLENISALLLFLIFFVGIGCGLISSRIMWGQVK